MPRKTLALIAGLVLVTAILFIIAIKTGQDQKSAKKQETAMNQPTATPDVAHSVLAMSPNPVVVLPGQKGTVTVDIDTADNLVTGVQLELSYDPKMVTNLKVAYGTLFTNPLVLFNKGNLVKGTYTYGFGIQPGQNPVTGKGTIATITFTAAGTVGQESQITMLPTTLVTARGTAVSVLKMGEGTTVRLGSSTGALKTNATAPKY